MSFKVKKIIGKSVITLTLVCLSSFQIFSVVSFATETTEVSTTDKQKEAREKLILYDYYSSSIYDKVDGNFIENLGSMIYNGFSSFTDFIFGDVDGCIQRLENCFDGGFHMNALTNKDFSEDLINKVVDIQDHYFVSKNGSRSVLKGESVSLEFYYPASIASPIGDNLDIVKSAYSNYIWGFQKTDGGTYWVGGYGISQGEILNICLNLYYSSSIYKVGLWHYKWGQSIGQFATINTYGDSLGICSYNYQVPFDCNFVWNEQERFDKVINQDKLKTLQNNVSNNNLGLQFGDSVLNLLKKVDKDGNINGAPVLNDDGSLNQDIINNYYKYGDSKFTELPENYNIEITDNNNNDDVVVVPDDNENNNFLTWVGSILDNIVNFFKYCYNGMREIYISAEGIVEYCSLIFDILPSPLGSLMKLALIIMLLVCVVNFVRG